MKNYIITAGGALEKWDRVRGHTNLAKGTIGTMVANELLRKGHQVTFVHGYFTTPISHENCKNILFEGVEDVISILKEHLETKQYYCVIMTAALSDWLVDEIYNQSGEILINEGKLSSSEPPIIKFKKAPKVLANIKKWDENVVLVGFKLESNVTKEEVIERACIRMKESNCDYMIANFSDSLYSQAAPHFIINKNNKVVATCESKLQTAQEITTFI